VPYIVAFIQQANQLFDPPGDWNPEALLESLEGVDTVMDGIEQFGLLDAIQRREYHDSARAIVSQLPPSLDAAVLAVLRSALSRGLKTQFTWKPAYAFELDIWESSRFEADAKAKGGGAWVGLVNVMILSPDPVED
jgi:hypothetical protein